MAFYIYIKPLFNYAGTLLGVVQEHRVDKKEARGEKIEGSMEHGMYL